MMMVTDTSEQTEQGEHHPSPFYKCLKHGYLLYRASSRRNLTLTS